MRKCVDEDLEGTGLKCKSDEEILSFVDRITIDIFSNTQKVDFSIQGKKPVYSNTIRHQSLSLYQSKNLKLVVGLRQNEIGTDDSFLPLGFNGFNSYTFWDIENILLSDRPRRASTIFFEMEVYLDPQIIYHSR